MGFMQNIFNKVLSTNTNVIIRKLCEISRPPLGGGYTDRKSVDMYRGWVYVAANHNATNVADAELKLFTNVAPKASMGMTITKSMLKIIRGYGIKASQDTQEIPDHPIVDLLNSPNNDDTLYSFLYKIDLFLELTGDAYVLIERNGVGTPIALYVLFSQYIDIQTDGQNQIIAYNYGVARDGKFDYRYAPEDIIHLKFFDPGNILHGISPLEACARSYGLINESTTHEEALNRNLGIPSGLLKYSSQKLKEEDRDLVEKKWQMRFAGVGRAGKMVVTDQDVTYDAIGQSPREMQFLQGRKWSREEILACYGVNPALLLTESVNRSNMITSSINYYHNTLRPRCKLISQALTNQLIQKNGLDGSNMFVVLTKEAPQDIENKLKEVTLLQQAGALTKNELRTTFGYDMFDDENADVLVQGNYMPPEGRL